MLIAEEWKLGMMWEEFETTADGQPKGMDEKTIQWMSAEAIFKRMLDALEREGDAEAGKPSLASLRGPTFMGGFKKKNKPSLLNVGKAVRLGVKLGAK